MAVEIKEGSMNSAFLREDYLPVVVAYGPSTDCCRHVVFEKSDTDALELCLDMDTGELLKIVLVLCNSYSCIDERMVAPTTTDAVLSFDLPRVTECEDLEMTVYSDGLRILLNDGDAASHAKAGSVIFCFTDDGSISEIYICDLDDGDISHVKSELAS